MEMVIWCAIARFLNIWSCLVQRTACHSCQPRGVHSQLREALEKQQLLEAELNEGQEREYKLGQTIASLEVTIQEKDDAAARAAEASVTDKGGMRSKLDCSRKEAAAARRAITDDMRIMEEELVVAGQTVNMHKQNATKAEAEIRALHEQVHDASSASVTP